MLERTERTERMLAAAAVDAYIAWRPEELVAACGHYSHWGASLALLVAGAQPLLIAPDGEPADTIPEGVRTARSLWGHSQTPWVDLARLVNDHLRETQGSRRLRIGYDARFGHASLPRNAAEFQPVDTSCIEPLIERATQSGHEVVAVGAAADQLLIYKNEADIAALGLTHRVADGALRQFYTLLRPGISEAAVAAEVESVVHRAVETDGERGVAGVAYSRGWAFVQSGPETGYTGTYNRSTGRRLADGDLVTIEFAVCVNGYWADLTRTGVVGRPSEEQAALHRVVYDAQRAAIAALRPGVTGGEIDAIAREVVAQAGWGDRFPHGLGHSTGFRYHDAGPVLAPGSPDILEAGMVVTIEPGIYVPAEFGCRIEDNVVVTATGCAELSTAPRGLGGEE